MHGTQRVANTAVLRLVFLILLPATAIGCATASPNGHVTPPRIALVGDSWPLMMRFHRGFDRALVEYGYRPRQVRGVAIGWSFIPGVESGMAYVGVEAAQFNDPAYFDALDRALAQYPTIDILHVGLGGTDLLHRMPPNASPGRKERFLQEDVLPNLDAVLTHLETAYPDKHIALVGYDYINFRDFVGRSHLTRARWERLGKPTPLEMNTLMQRLNELQRDLVQRRHPNVAFVDYMGQTRKRLRMEHDLSEPNPEAALWRDGMHLSVEGNTDLALYCLDAAYRAWLFPLRDIDGNVIAPANLRKTRRSRATGLPPLP